MIFKLTTNLRSWTKNIIKVYNIKARKKLGQHFIVNYKLITDVIDACKKIKPSVVFEVGTGLGTLTYFLAQEVPYVVTVEIDKKLALIAKREVLRYVNNTDLIVGDGVNLLKNINADTLTSNAPYVITGPLLIAFLKSKIKNAILVLQYDVVQRLLAKPGSKKYGKITLLTDFFTLKEKGPIYSQESFFPKPQVFSQLIILKKKSFNPKDLELIEPLIKCLFSYRLKLAKKALKKCLEIMYGIKLSINGELNEKRVIQLSVADLEKIITLVKKFT